MHEFIPARLLSGAPRPPSPPARDRRPGPRRVLLSLAVVSASIGASLLSSPAATAAGPGATPATVAGLAAEVARTAAGLTDGTRRLEQAQARLTDLQTRQGLARSAAQTARARAGAARARLGSMVGAEYRSPRPALPLLVLAGGPAGIGETVRGLVTLDQVRGNQQATLADADRERRTADRLAAEADRLAAAAAGEKEGVAAQVAELGRAAQDASDRLAQAAAALKTAQDERAAAAQRASRDRAATAPPVAAAVPGGGAGCSGGNLSGYPNGMLPTSALCPLDGTNGLVLRADAAAAFNRMAAVGGMPCAGNSYRSYAEQVALYRQKPSLAAVPGTSNHGWGVAVDFACGADNYGSAAYRWLKANGPAYGWTHPAWAEPGGNRPEPWHWEYQG